MKIDASPATIRAVTAALGKAKLLDDQIADPDQGRIAAWAEVVEPNKFSHDDLVEAVADFYSGNVTGRTLKVGDLVHHAKLVRRERTEREPDEHREARQAALDAKVAERIDDLAGAAFTPAYDRPSRQGINPLTVPCPYCHAGPGYVCENTAFKGGRPRRHPHPSRIDAAKETAA